MAFESFVARRLFPRDTASRNVSIHTLVATTAIALGVLVMVTAVSILRGFQGEIRQKVVGFGSHIVVQGFQMGNTYETSTPIAVDRPEVERLRHSPGVRHLQFFAQKGGMAKTENEIHGIILKGVSSDYDTSFFSRHLIVGRLVNINVDKPSNEVLISQTIADKLEISVGDKLRTWFWRDPNTTGGSPAPAPNTTGGSPARAFTVCGIYKTDLNDFDEHYIIGDLRQVQRLNGWDSTLVDGYEILVDDFSRLDAVAAELLQLIPYDLTLVTIVQQNPALFSWLDLLDSNIVLIITIMILVCAVAILSALLIMIFEKTSTIGMLKALGATNTGVRRIFLIKSGGIILRGILIGDATAFLLCGLQHHFRFVRLDSASYSMDFVPVDLNPWIFILVSLGTLLLCLLTLLLPTAYISNIHPAKTIRFE